MGVGERGVGHDPPDPHSNTREPGDGAVRQPAHFSPGSSGHRSSHTKREASPIATAPVALGSSGKLGAEVNSGATD